MLSDQIIGVTVPAFNEALHIEKTVINIPDFVDFIVVVDDGSDDSTLEIARDLKRDGLSVISQVNQGVGGAILAGHRKLLELGCDVMCVMAGDNQMDPNSLQLLLAPILNLNERHSPLYVKGTRLYSKTGRVGMPWHRVIGNYILTYLSKVSTGQYDISDPQNGYTAITRSAFEKLPKSKLKSRYDFENSMLIWISICNIPVVDVPIKSRYADEKSTINYSTAVPSILITLFSGLALRILYQFKSF